MKVESTARRPPPCAGRVFVSVPSSHDADELQDRTAIQVIHGVLDPNEGGGRGSGPVRLQLVQLGQHQVEHPRGEDEQDTIALCSALGYLLTYTPLPKHSKHGEKSVESCTLQGTPTDDKVAVDELKRLGSALKLLKITPLQSSYNPYITMK